MVQQDDASVNPAEGDNLYDEQPVSSDGSLSNLLASAVGAFARPVGKRLMRPVQHAAHAASEPVIEQTVVMVQGVLDHPAIQSLIENQIIAIIDKISTNPQILDRLVAVVAGRYLRVLAEDPAQL